jgi:hypothetical protein
VDRAERRLYDFTREPKSRLYSLVKLELVPLFSPFFAAVVFPPLIMLFMWSPRVGPALFYSMAVVGFLGMCVSGLGWWRSGRAVGLLLTPARIAVGVPMVYLAFSAPVECEGDTCTLYGNPEIVTLLGFVWLGLVAASCIGLAVAERRTQPVLA